MTFQTNVRLYGAASVAGTLDPAKTGSAIALSGGNLTATATASGTATLTNASLSQIGYVIGGANQRYFEFSQTVGGNGLFHRAGLILGFQDGLQFIMLCDGIADVFLTTGSSESSPTIDTIALNNVVGFAADFATQKFWIKNITKASGWNNDILANQNPDTGAQVGGFNMNAHVTTTGQTAYAALALTGTGNASRINLSGSFAGTLPGGFSAWS